MNEIINTSEFHKFVDEIDARIQQARLSASLAVNKELLQLYWDIGKEIANRQELYGWGKSVVEELAQELQARNGKATGFSSRNLWRMRNFYESFPDTRNLPPAVAEISWSKLYVILEKCKDDQEREFYFRMVKKYGWTKDVLIHNIEIKTYERYMTSQTNFDSMLPVEYRHQADLAVKDEYTFDFLELTPQHTEKELERELIAHIQRFLSEMGGMYAFIGNQYRIVVDGDEFFIDLLLYHRKLRCMVAIELKIGKFEPADAGQLQFYLAALDAQEKLPDENPSIGIIICRSKNRTVVEYALKSVNAPMGVATYQIQNELPKSLKKLLPEPEEIAKRLDEIDRE